MFVIGIPFIRNDPDISTEPVITRLSTPSNNELPDTKRDPLTTAPLDAVIEDRCALLPLNITLFQDDNFYSIVYSNKYGVSVKSYDYYAVGVPSTAVEYSEIPHSFSTATDMLYVVSFVKPVIEI